jgi:tetratricopeptide (TPR) repeat protein
LLKDALHATERIGSARLVSVIGEPGIGKTRLAWELRKYVGGLIDDVYWHDGRSPAYDQVPTFWALGQMVKQRAGIHESDDPIRSRTKLRTAVVEYVADPVDQEWVEPRLAALLGLAPEETREPADFFAAVRRFFQSIAERGTTLLIFEDFHWADSGLIEFARELVERSPHHPILVLTLARPDLLERVPGWGAGRRNFTSVHLGPLSEAEMTELLVGMVEGLDPAVAESIEEYANGIPLYAVELVRMLIADGVLTRGEACCIPNQDLTKLRVPDTVRAVIGARLDRLPAASRSLLQDAAVFGTAFRSEGLAAMIGLSLRRVEELLETLVHREILEVDGDRPAGDIGRYHFVQSLVREVAYSRLTNEERRVRHLRAAEYLDGLQDVELAGAVASHYMDAHNVTDDKVQAAPLAAEASAALVDAAERAAGLHSHEQALAMLEHALSLTDDPRAKADLQQRAARSAGVLARHDLAIDYACSALSWYQDHGDDEEIAEAARLVGFVLSHAFKAPEAIKVLEPVVAGDPSLARPSSVRAASELARAYLMSVRNQDAADMSDRVIGPAERFGLADTTIDVLITRGTALGNLGRLHEAVALLQGALEYARRRDLPLSEMRAANNLGHLLQYDDHFAALDACRRGLEKANRLGDVRFIGSFTWAVAAYVDRDGRFAEGQRMRDEVRERIQLPPDSVAWYEFTDLMSVAIQGDESAIELAREAMARSVDEENPQSVLSIPYQEAALDFLAGDFKRTYERMLSVDEDERLPDHVQKALFAAAMLRDRGRLATVASQLARCRARGRMVVSLTEAADAAIAAVEGRAADAVAAFDRALAFEYLELDRAELMALYATLVGSEVPEARRASDAAFETFTRCGASAYIEVFAEGMPPQADQLAAGE